jgi:6-phosphofructokinase 1
MKNIIVGQSGGPTAVINSSVAGVYKKAKELGVERVYGMVYGIEGFLNENIIDLDDYLNNDENYELLKRTPSAFLGSCRYKLPKIEDNKEVYEKIFEILDKYEIDALFYIGGNDSMDTIKMLSDYAKENNKKQVFMGVPKTIDNDLPITDHCPGYGSSAKYIATSLKEVIRDNASFGVVKPTVCIVEIMGRHAGWLAAAAALAKDDTCEGVDAIYLPESKFDLDEFVASVEELAKTKHSIVIAVSEGVKTSDGKFVCELSNEHIAVDAFGHKQLSGCGQTLANIVATRTGLKTRAIEYSTLQRAATHIASLTDINEAEMVGMKAVEEANNGKTGMMVIITRDDSNGYTSSADTYDIHDIANVEKKIPLEWIDEENKQMKEEFIKYAKPLIQGELAPIFKDGLPVHLIRK